MQLQHHHHFYVINLKGFVKFISEEVFWAFLVIKFSSRSRNPLNWIVDIELLAHSSSIIKNIAQMRIIWVKLKYGEKKS